MTTLKEFTAERLAATGRNPFEAARIGGLERTFVRDILIERKVTVLGRNIARLAVALDTTPEEIAAAMDETVRPTAGGLSEEAPPFRLARRGADGGAAPESAFSRGERVPVYGDSSERVVTVGRGFEGFRFDADSPVDFRRRPPALFGIGGGYAVYAPGNSMEPMHKAGTPLYVHPGRPVQPEDTVVIKVRAGSEIHAFVKTFVGRDSNRVVARQIKPAATHQFDASTVIAVHRVLTYGELVEI